MWDAGRFSIFDASINCRWIWTGFVSASNQKVNLQKSLFYNVSSFKWKKGLIGLQDSYQNWLLFFFNMHMYNEFYVLDVLIVLLYMWRLNSQGYWFKQRGEERCVTTLKMTV